MVPSRVLLAALLLGCHAGSVTPATTPPVHPTNLLTDEPAPQGPPLGETICLAGAARYQTMLDPAAFADEITQYKALGVKRVRYDIDWTDVETVQGQYNVDWIEQPLAMLEAAGMKSIVTLDYGNPLYNSSSNGDTSFPPTTPAPFAAFAAAVAQRYGERLSPYEIWNEENAGYRFWKPKEDPTAYAALLLRAAQSIKEVCPACQVIFGGVFWHAEAIMGGPKFIQDAYAAQPLLATALSGLGVHPYAYYPPSAPPDSDLSPEVPLVDMIAQAQSATGDAAKPPVWVTEVGWPIQTGSVDDAAQAADLVKAYVLASEVQSQATCWYDLQDGPNADSFPPEQAFGLIYYDPAGPSAGKPKHAYLSMQALTTLLGTTSFSKNRGAECGLSKWGDAALFLRDAAGTRGVTVLWRTDHNYGSTAQIPLHSGTSRSLYDDAGLPLTLTESNDVATVQVGSAPVFLVETSH
jgi:hypothetical protein